MPFISMPFIRGSCYARCRMRPLDVSDINSANHLDAGKRHLTTEYDPHEPINNTPIIGLYMGRQRPLFHHDAPRWLTGLVFAFFLAIILASILLR